MGRPAKSLKPYRPRARSAHVLRLASAIESYVHTRGAYLEAAAGTGSAPVAKRRADLAAAEAAVVELLEGRLPVVHQGYLYALEGKALRPREVQVID